MTKKAIDGNWRRGISNLDFEYKLVAHQGGGYYEAAVRDIESKTPCGYIRCRRRDLVQ